MKKSFVKMQWKKIRWQNKKLVLSVCLVTATLFLLYQLMLMFLLGYTQNKNTLNEEPKTYHNIAANPSISKTDILHIFNDKGLIRGIKLSDIEKYKPNKRGMFTCFKTNNEIEFSMVNDDYCDCPEDGSDEPGTNACNNGKFHCAYQPKHSSKKTLFVPSNRVNDGICDCCDGSDEWINVSVLEALPFQLQKKLGRYQVPCINICLSRL